MNLLTDDRWIVLDVTVENTSRHEELELEADDFVLVLESGVELDADAASESVAGACERDETLTYGAETACTIVFEAPVDVEALTLRYESPGGRVGEAAVDLPACEWCEETCTDLSVDPDNCGACGEVVAADQVCEGGRRVCTVTGETLCDDECADLQSDPDHCGACDEPVPPDHVCEDGEPDCEERGLQSCPDGCFDLDEDGDHCGACDLSCDQGDECLGGRTCRDYEQESDANVTCDDVCAAAGRECSSAMAFYGSYYSCDYDDRASIACDELPPSDNGYCTHFDTLGCWCDYEPG